MRQLGIVLLSRKKRGNKLNVTRVVQKDFADDEYTTLIALAFKEADSFEFTIKEMAVKVNAENGLNEHRLEEAYTDILTPLQDFLIYKRRSKRENIAHIYERDTVSHIFRYKAINRAKAVIQTFTDHAFGWSMGDALPEYLTFYKEDKPLFVIIEDESEVWFYEESEKHLIPALISYHEKK